MPMQMTPHYWQLFVSQQTVVSISTTANPSYGDLILSVVSICATPNLDILGVRLTANSPSKTTCAVSLVSSKNWYYEVDEARLCGHLCVASLLLCICSPNP